MCNLLMFANSSCICVRTVPHLFITVSGVIISAISMLQRQKTVVTDQCFSILQSLHIDTINPNTVTFMHLSKALISLTQNAASISYPLWSKFLQNTEQWDLKAFHCLTHTAQQGPCFEVDHICQFTDEKVEAQKSCCLLKVTEVISLQQSQGQNSDFTTPSQHCSSLLCFFPSVLLAFL